MTKYNPVNHTYYATDSRNRAEIPVDIPKAEFDLYAREKQKALMSDEAVQVYLMKKRDGYSYEFSPKDLQGYSPEKINAMLPVLRKGRYSLETASEAYEHDQRNKSNPSVLEALKSTGALNISSIQRLKGGEDLCKALCQANSQEAMNWLLDRKASYLYDKGVSPSDLLRRGNDVANIKLSMVYEGAQKIHGISGEAFHHALPDLLDHSIATSSGEHSVLETVMKNPALLKQMINSEEGGAERSPASLVLQMLATTHRGKDIDGLKKDAEHIVRQGPGAHRTQTYR